MKKTLSTLLLIIVTRFLFSQEYHYTIDLNQLTDDQLSVTLQVPAQKEKRVLFNLPKIIPGTYAISNYGLFTSEVKALDKNGKLLPVTRLDTNRWEIKKAKKLATITYTVEDIFDTHQEHAVYPMAATNFEDKNVVLHAPGIFGYLKGQNRFPFSITIHKPSTFYASTSAVPISHSETQDVFTMKNLDELYDTPIMYGVPDTATVKVGNCDVLVSVYSPHQQIHASEIVGWLSDLLQGARKYLGGKLPANRYAFLYYFKSPDVNQSFKGGIGGALEHPTSSFYYLPERPAEQMKKLIVDVSSHEFFHIITPLTIASKEVKAFNYQEPVLSEHLWLYEGSTEYTAHHVQVKCGLNTAQQFLDKLADKIRISREQYNDTLAFTKLSKYAASTYADQYGNVYQKGALIAACLDLYLLHLSEGGYGLKDLTHDLGIRFGKDSYFLDEQLFDEIERLTYPEIKQFLVTYVQGNTPIPYQEFFRLAGVQLNSSAAHTLSLTAQANPNQLRVRKAWLEHMTP